MADSDTNTSPRPVSLGAPRGAFLAGAIFLVAILLTSLELLPVQIALTMAALAMILTRIIPIREIYTSVEWPVIVLLGAMMPLGEALEATGGAATVAQALLTVGAGLPSVVTLGLLFVVTMILSNIINNAAAAVLMAPIAIGIAKTRARREIAGHLIAPGFIQGVFHYREQFDMRIAELGDIGNQLIGQFPKRQKVA